MVVVCLAKALSSRLAASRKSPSEDNVVAVEDRARFMTTALHGDPFGNPRADHIPHGRPPEIVWDLSGRSCLSTSPLPGFVVPDDTLTVSMKYIRASEVLAISVEKQTGSDIL